MNCAPCWPSCATRTRPATPTGPRGDHAIRLPYGHRPAGAAAPWCRAMVATARILVVDDEVALMRVLCETLQIEGYETVGCASAEEALPVLDRPGESFDLVLTDLMMPGIDGIGLLREACRKDPVLAGVRRAGGGTIGTAGESMKAGALDYILKPFRLFEALPVLTRALGIRRLRLDNIALERQVRAHAAELELKNEELEAFSYSVSHDLRAPLRRIDQFANILVGDHGAGLAPEARRLLDRICANTGLMGTLIDDLLALSHVTSGVLQPEDVDLSAEARSIIEGLQAQDPARTVAVTIQPGIRWRADRGLAHIMLENLLGNAWKYSAKNPRAVIEMGWHPTVPGTWFIRDNGAGFDMKQAGRLFKPFQRMHRAEDFAGTRIGLSIVARIVGRHQGTIRAESAPGAGATFLVTAAAADQPAPVALAQHAPSPS